MVFATYRDLFTAIAATSGALTGLLFVAMSVAPRLDRMPGPPVLREVRVAAALLAFINALAVALYGLVPGTNVGYPALSLGILGLAFTAAAIRSIMSSNATSRQRLRQVGLIFLLLLIFGTEVIGGIAVLANPHSVSWLQTISYALATSLIVGIARAWELVGERDTGLVASIAVLVGRTPAGAEPRQRPDSPGPPEASG